MLHLLDLSQTKSKANEVAMVFQTVEALFNELHRIRQDCHLAARAQTLLNTINQSPKDWRQHICYHAFLKNNKYFDEVVRERCLGSSYNKVLPSSFHKNKPLLCHLRDLPLSVAWLRVH